MSILLPPAGSLRPLLGAWLFVVASQGDVLAAQSILGTVRDVATDAPVGVAMVVLEDAGGQRLAATLTNDRGGFVFRALDPDRYRVRIERIGFRTYTTDAFELVAGEDLSLDLRIRTEAIRLDDIVVSGAERRCRLPREEGTAIVTLWDEARKSLELAVWGEAEGGVHFRVRGHERVLDLVTEDVREQRFRAWSGTARDPFFASPAGELAREGFVVDDGDGHYTYFGLSAATILSDAFQETHCFRIRRPGRGQPAEQIGLAFEPVPGRSLPDVAGVLWLDGETAELRRVEYTYTRHLVPMPLPLDPFGGRTDFRRLANGAVITEAWWIRMPRFEGVVLSDDLPLGTAVTRFGRETDGDRTRQLRRAGLTIREVGATAVSIAGMVSAEAAGDIAGIRGVLHDSIAEAPLAGATVYVAGAGHRTVTDSAGRFHLDGVPAGTWDLAFDHPLLDALGWAVEPLVVSVRAGETLQVGLATPSVATVLGARCEPHEDWIVGFVWSEAVGSPVAGVVVVTEWTEGWRREGEAFTGERVRRGAVTDEAGAYVLCDIRPGARRRVELEGRPGSARSVDLWAGKGARLDFVVGTRR